MPPSSTCTASRKPDGYNKAHLQSFGQVLQAWMISQIPGGATALEQLVCDGKTLTGSAIETEDGHHRFVAQVTVYARALGHRPGPEELRHPRIQRAGGTQRAVEHDGPGRQADPGGCPALHPTVFQWCLEQGADLLLTVKSNQKTLHRQIGCQFQGKRHIPLTATDHEKRHGRQTVWALRAREAPDHIKDAWPGSAWIVELITTTTKRNGKRRVTRHYYGLRPTASTSQP